jgi:hypothetical protein
MAAAEPSAFGLFEAYGVELEYMIVDAHTLDVRPIADRLIEAEHGAIENEIERDAFAWSNELARHVVEIKTNGPARELAGLARGFAQETARIDALLAPHGARLLPTAMHPWMDPAREFELWPHGDGEIYAAFDRIFDCRGHGWSNLQSAHLNLPFADDDQFGCLHAAARALLPLLPALAASSPFVEGRHHGMLDARLDVYRHNARRVPSLTGAVVPEAVFTRSGYEALLASLYADLDPLDPDGTLRHEWVNARGAIARFDRMAMRSACSTCRSARAPTSRSPGRSRHGCARCATPIRATRRACARSRPPRSPTCSRARLRRRSARSSRTPISCARSASTAPRAPRTTSGARSSSGTSHPIPSPPSTVPRSTCCSATGVSHAGSSRAWARSPSASR